MSKYYNENSFCLAEPQEGFRDLQEFVDPVLSITAL